MMEDREFKKLMEDSVEGPSYGFSKKTMRKIDELDRQKVSLSIRANKSAIAYLIPSLFIVLLITSFFLGDSSSFAIDLSFKGINQWWSKLNFSFSVLAGSLALALGFWVWILWEKSNPSAR